MVRKWCACSLFFILPALGWAQLNGVTVPDLSPIILSTYGPGTYTQAELAAIVAEKPNVKISDLTFDEYAKISARLQVARKKDSLITDAVKESLLLPGLAQAKNGNLPLAAGFFVGDLAILGVAAYASYQLLPSDYKNGKGALSLNSGLLPSMGVTALGWLVWESWGALGAWDAAPERRRLMDSHKLEVVPDYQNNEIGFTLKW